MAIENIKNKDTMMLSFARGAYPIPQNHNLLTT